MLSSSSNVPKDDEILFYSRAKVAPRKWFGTFPEGTLVATNDRLLFIRGQSIYYDFPLSRMTDIQKKWWYLGQQFDCTVNGTVYLFQFTKLSSMTTGGKLLRVAGAQAAGELLAMAGAVKGVMDMAKAHKLCEAWLNVIYQLQSRPSSAPAPLPVRDDSSLRACVACGHMFSRMSVQCPSCQTVDV